MVPRDAVGDRDAGVARPSSSRTSADQIRLALGDKLGEVPRQPRHAAGRCWTARSTSTELSDAELAELPSRAADRRRRLRRSRRRRSATGIRSTCSCPNGTTCSGTRSARTRRTRERPDPVEARARPGPARRDHPGPRRRAAAQGQRAGRLHPHRRHGSRRRPAPATGTADPRPAARRGPWRPRTAARASSSSSTGPPSPRGRAGSWHRPVAAHRDAHRRNFERRFSETAEDVDPDDPAQAAPLLAACTPSPTS